EGLSPRGLPATSLFRPHPPLPAGLDAARGISGGLPAGEPPPSPDRPVEIHQSRPSLGLALGPVRGDVATVALAPAGQGRGALKEPRLSRLAKQRNLMLDP